MARTLTSTSLGFGFGCGTSRISSPFSPTTAAFILSSLGHVIVSIIAPHKLALTSDLGKAPREIVWTLRQRPQRGGHCHSGAQRLLAARVFDWLDETLGHG